MNGVSTVSPEAFAHLWGRRSRGAPPDPPRAEKLQRLKDVMIAKGGAVDHNVAAYVQAALEYGVELTRSEYRPLANRNWKAIQGFGVRVMRVLAVLAIVLLFLGWKTLTATTDIQHDRRASVLQKCHSGEAFDRKLKAKIAKLPEPQKAMAMANEKFTEELIATVVPISHDHCKTALAQAGLK